MKATQQERQGRKQPPNKDMNAHMRSAQALALRCQGLTYAAIAEQCGYASGAGAYKAIKRALHEVIHEGVNELRQLEGARLEALQAALWERAVGKGPDASWASARILAIIDQRAKLFGLYPKLNEETDKGVIREYIGINIDDVLGMKPRNGYQQIAQVN